MSGRSHYPTQATGSWRNDGRRPPRRCSASLAQAWARCHTPRHRIQVHDPILRGESIMNEHDGTTRSAVATGKQTEVAVLAGGCFWGVEDILRNVPGVIDTDVGYTGGWLENPTYDDTHDSKSGRAEANHQDYLRTHPGGYTCHFMRD